MLRACANMSRCWDAGGLDAVNRLTNSIAVLLTISYGGWLAVCGRLTVGFIYSAFTFSFQLAMGFSNLVTMTGDAHPVTRQICFLLMCCAAAIFSFSRAATCRSRLHVVQYLNRLLVDRNCDCGAAVGCFRKPVPTDMLAVQGT